MNHQLKQRHIIKITAMAPTALPKSLKGLWMLTKDDLPTLIFPNTVFGICSAIACARASGSDISTFQILCRLPEVFLFNYTNLIVFDLSNQRDPESAVEDKINKPWRPVPAGLLTCDEMRQLLMLAIPCVLLFNIFALGTGTQTAILFILTWINNDLKAADESWFLKNGMVALALGFYNFGSLKVALGNETLISNRELGWIVIISIIILSSMHVQDLKDVAGDRLKGRETIPIIIGLEATRWTLIPPIILGTVVSTFYWGISINALSSVALASHLVYRCIIGGDKMFDRKTWQLWCFWTATLYTIPLTCLS